MTGARRPDASGEQSGAGHQAHLEPAFEHAAMIPTAARMTSLGERLAGLLAAGDLVVLSGPLGAGKTTLTQGIGAGLQVRGRVTSPTFVIARVHPSLAGGPDLVHADAYRLGSRAEVDDLDLDADLATSVTVVEWGEGLVEGLADSFLSVRIEAQLSSAGSDAEDDRTRMVRLTGWGERWLRAAAGASKALAGASKTLAG
jgi:tRNA threonylcarbamoyladenosine biosynthesis protein TsaE